MHNSDGAYKTHYIKVSGNTPEYISTLFTSALLNIFLCNTCSSLVLKCNIFLIYYYFSWIMDVEGPPDTLYDGEKFSLSFQFNARYPFDSPIVLFVGDNIPIHPHVYSNGHICLSILTEGWSPALSVESVCLSIMSMLASAKEKVRILLFWIMYHQNFLSFKFGN